MADNLVERIKAQVQYHRVALSGDEHTCTECKYWHPAEHWNGHRVYCDLITMVDMPIENMGTCNNISLKGS